MSAYLAGADLTTYGVPSASAGDITQASGMVDSYLGWPEGIAYATDPRGAPCYMVGATPAVALTLASAIAPGLNVSVTVSGFVTQDLIGEVLIADRQAQTPNAEALVVSAVQGQTLTFASVLAAHAAGAALEPGLVLAEERSLPDRRSIARVSKTPIARLIAGGGRYSYSRRSSDYAGFRTPDLIACLAQFGSTPLWIPFDVTQVSVSSSSAEIWIPAGLYLDTFSDVRLRYIGGFPQANLPTQIKAATAKVIMASSNFPEMTGNIKKLQAGGTSIERFADGVLDADTKAILAPFMAKVFF